MEASDEYEVDFPTLGFLVADWCEAHCIVPDGFHKGRPYVMADWQLWCTANFYRVRPEASWDPEAPRVSTNFVYRRAQIVAPQKTGKGPWLAAIIAAEALGPTVFVGWAEDGDFYSCADHGCDCGWEYDYEAGEPMGMPRPTPLIQLTATAKDQTANVYRPLKAMFKAGWSTGESRIGEEFIKIGEDGRIDTVTSSAKARLGNPVTFVGQDETGIYTESNGMVEVATTQRRGLAGMDARSIETTNCWDPAERSVAQRTYEATAPDVFKFYRKPPANLSFRNKVERRKILEFVYAGSWWVNLDAIDAEASEILETDPSNAERFFGNRLVSHSGVWLLDGLWVDAESGRRAEDGAIIAVGFDGSESDDWTALRCETIDGLSFTPRYGPDSRPTIWNPEEWGGSIPRSEVHAAVDELHRRFFVVRFYGDPRDWQSEIGDWAAKHGDHVAEWATYRVTAMHEALVRFVVDLKSGRLLHDGCPITTTHVANARKLARPGERYILGKPTQHQKIDAGMSAVLAHEAASDAHASGEFERAKNRQNRKIIVLR